MSDANNNTDMASSMEKAHNDRRYYYFVFLSVGTLLAALVIVVIPRILIYICRATTRGRKSKNNEKTDTILIQPSVYSNVQVS